MAKSTVADIEQRALEQLRLAYAGEDTSFDAAA
jgi:hypothetical protein